MNAIEQALSRFGPKLLDEAAAMRKAGVSQDEVLRGLERSLIDWARAHGWVKADREIPPYLWKHCPVCQDTGWEPTKREWRGEIVEAYRRCSCKPVERQDGQAAAIDRVASGWKQVGRR